MFLRTVKGSNADYLYLIEGYRENGKVKQKTLISFGKITDLDPKQLTEMGLKLLGLCPGNSLIDINNTDELSRKNWGIPLIINQLWKNFKLDDLFTQLQKDRKIKYDLANTIQLMLADRLHNPCSKYKTYTSKNYYQDFANIELHNIYKSLNELSLYKEQIEQHLFIQCQSQFNLELEVIFFDVTTFYFESINADELKNFGYGKDGKFNEVQVVLSLMVNKDGLPVGFDLFPGNTYEGHTLNDAVFKLKNKYNIKKIVVVADRGINTGSNLINIKDKKFEYIVGCRIKNLSKDIQKTILDLDNYSNINISNSDDIVKYKIISFDKKIKDSKGKVINVIKENIICTWSSKRAKKDAKDRERLVEKAKSLISCNKIENKRGAKKYINATLNSAPTLNSNKIIEDAQWDGFYGIETSDKTLTTDVVMDAYHTLWRIEESFKLYKSHLEARPVYHWTPERIKGHFVLSYIAFLFERTLEVQLHEFKTIPATPVNLREAMSKMEFSELLCGNKSYKLHAKIDELGEKILNLLNIDIPKRSLTA